MMFNLDFPKMTELIEAWRKNNPTAEIKDEEIGRQIFNILMAEIQNKMEWPQKEE